VIFDAIAGGNNALDGSWSSAEYKNKASFMSLLAVLTR